MGKDWGKNSNGFLKVISQNLPGKIGRLKILRARIPFTSSLPAAIAALVLSLRAWAHTKTKQEW
jgi:hypothetical protein